MKKILATLSGVLAAAALMASPLLMAAPTTTIYDNIPSPIPSNVPSVGFEATSTSEFGGGFQFASTQRENPTVTVLMSSWACEDGTWNAATCATSPGATFNHPITLKVYELNADNTVGDLLVEDTQSYEMPYRPSTNLANCPTGGGWYDGTSCKNGKAFTISHTFNGVTLPEDAIISVAYNTSHHGYVPIGTSDCSSEPEGCPYDSLNVGTSPSPTVGTALPSINDVYQNSTWAGAYCDENLATGTFRLDSGCWSGFLPAIEVSASDPIITPSTKEQCKKDGYKDFTDLDGNAFKNQGQCVAYVASKGRVVGNFAQLQF